MTVSAANLRLYLSGGSSNADPALSLGGARSTHALSASALNNLFDDVTGSQASAGHVEYRCLYFVNEDTDAVGLITPVLWVDAPNISGVATGELIAYAVDLAGKNAVADTIADTDTAPSPTVTWVTGTTKGAGLALPSGPYAEDDEVAIWLRRTTPSSQGVSAGTEFTVHVEGES
jgi:hypothetical protein